MKTNANIKSINLLINTTLSPKLSEMVCSETKTVNNK